MNPAINEELIFFLVSILSGILLLAAYDILRILRRLIRHNAFVIALEDLIFWVLASLFIFAMIYRENDGIIRGFSAMGVLLGSVLYHYAFSDLLVGLITKLIRVLLQPISMFFRQIGKLVRFLLSRMKQLRNNQLLRLKKKWKSVKISLENRKMKKAKEKEAQREETKKKEAQKKEAQRKEAQRKEAQRKEAQRKEVQREEAQRKETQGRETQGKETQGRGAQRKGTIKKV